MRVVTIVGARPQFIKAAPVAHALREAGYDEQLVHTGQHYDPMMSQVFFDELTIPTPAVNLGIGSGPHGEQTGTMLAAIERELMARRPDWVLVYGDTNSTLAGALAAAKLGIGLAHVEAGLRSYNRSMPEEHNRVLTDHCADLLCCPTDTAVRNLEREGLTEGVRHVGDPMHDVLATCRDRARARSEVFDRLALGRKGYFLATVHRAYNTDDPVRLTAIFTGLGRLPGPVVVPLHPRTAARLNGNPGAPDRVPSNVRIIDPVGYMDMIALAGSATTVLTDSGGLQKEAFWLGVPCVTLRPETEWVETVELGWNVLADADPDRIVAAVADTQWPTGSPPAVFGAGDAGRRIAEALAP